MRFEETGSNFFKSPCLYIYNLHIEFFSFTSYLTPHASFLHF